jgi:predicted GNAT family N-acyltransferase
MEIRAIEMSGPEYTAVYKLRDRVLRQPIGLSLDEEDLSAEVSEFTLAAFDAEALMGCVMLRPLRDGEMKLRQMAVYPEFQGRKVGAALVAAAEAFAREKGFDVMSMHARDYAIPFYEKSGYRVEGEGFEEVGIPHHLMLKKL